MDGPFSNLYHVLKLIKMDITVEYKFLQGTVKINWSYIFYLFGQSLCLATALSGTTDTALQQELINVNVTNKTLDYTEQPEFDYTQ